MFGSVATSILASGLAALDTTKPKDNPTARMAEMPVGSLLGWFPALGHVRGGVGLAKDEVLGSDNAAVRCKPIGDQVNQVLQAREEGLGRIHFDSVDHRKRDARIAHEK
jgi:hypothetical protein